MNQVHSIMHFHTSIILPLIKMKPSYTEAGNDVQERQLLLANLIGLTPNSIAAVVVKADNKRKNACSNSENSTKLPSENAWHQKRYIGSHFLSYHWEGILDRC
jgi:hypothetical protein